MIEVTAAVIHKDEKLLICQRPEGKRCELLWEFPGGTISAEFAAAAQTMAKRRLEQAEEDDAYAKANYYADLERAKLYADTDKRMK